MKHILLLLLASTCLFAKDLGQSGTGFPIVEDSLAETMKSKAALHEPEIEAYSEEIEAYIQNPTPIAGIGKASEKRTIRHDPTYTLEEDIVIEGELIAKAGMTMNPLEEMTLPGGLLFFDASDPAQIAWAKAAPPDFKWILVKGSPIALEEKEERPVYFDQFGLFTSKFQIQNVPAKVSQDGKYLLVEEIPVDEEGRPKP